MAVRITRAGVALTVGIIVLTGIIVGGLLWAKEAGEQARREEAIKVAEQRLEEQSRDEVARDDSDKTTPEAEQAPGDEHANHDTPGQTPQTGADQSAVDTLPETGANDGLAILVAAITTYSVVAYLRSRSV